MMPRLDQAGRALAAALLLAGCASKPAARTASAELGAPAACETLLERPADHQLAAATTPTGEDKEKARSIAEARAFTALQERLCRGWRCDLLEEGIRVVDVKEQEGNTCAQAAVSASFVTSWLKPAQDELDEALASEAARIKAALKDSAAPRVVIAPVIDMGVEGGQRARWLREQVAAALKAAGVEVIAAPPEWRGLGLPAGAQGVLRGVIRPGRARKERFELVWELQSAAGRAQGPVHEIVRALADDVAPETARAELLTSELVSAQVAAPDSGLCAGAQSALWVTLAQPMFVRVFAVYGQERAALIYPRAAADKGRLDAGSHELVKLVAGPLDGVDAARFVVVGSPDEEGLGRMKALDRACAMPVDSARKLHAGGAVAPTAIKTTAGAGYRLPDAATCEEAPERVATGLEWILDLPTCWEK